MDGEQGDGTGREWVIGFVWELSSGFSGREEGEGKKEEKKKNLSWLFFAFFFLHSVGMLGCFFSSSAARPLACTRPRVSDWMWTGFGTRPLECWGDCLETKNLKLNDPMMNPGKPGRGWGGVGEECLSLVFTSG